MDVPCTYKATDCSKTSVDVQSNKSQGTNPVDSSATIEVKLNDGNDSLPSSSVNASTDRMQEPTNCPPKATLSYSKRAIKRRNRAAQQTSLSKKSKTCEPSGFTSDLFTDTDYYFENGLRKVYPYYFSYTSYAKGRWVGRTLLDVYTSEFRGDVSDHEGMMEAGNISVNGTVMPSDYVLKNNDFISHTMHRHENPVSNQPIEILHLDDEVIVINKPSSIPCHPCGKYRFNSVLFILGKELGLDQLRNIYRLDRLTSGVLIMGRADHTTKQLEAEVAQRRVQKEYLCRVAGDFPEGITTVDQPLGCISHKLSLYRVDASGKPSQTEFEKVHHDGRSSIVKCRPHTGRTHQIRVHLQYLGHPIVNDPLYNTPAWGPHRCKGGVLGQTLDELQDAIRAEHHVGRYIHIDDPKYAEYFKHEPPAVSDDSITEFSTDSHVMDDATKTGAMENSANTEIPEKPTTEYNVQCGSNRTETDIVGTICTKSKDVVKYLMHRNCYVTKTISTRNGEMAYLKMSDNAPQTNEANSDDRTVPILTSTLCGRTKVNTSDGYCLDPNKWIKDEDCNRCQRRYINPKPQDLVMYLHALRYKGPGWEFSTDVPDWAKPDWHLD